MSCSVLIACAVAAAAHTSPPPVTSGVIAVGAQNGREMAWKKQTGSKYQLTIAGKPQPLALPLSRLQADTPDLGTESNGDQVVIYTPKRGQIYEFNVKTQKSKKLVNGGTGSMARGVLAYDDKTSIAFRQPSGKTTRVPFAQYLTGKASALQNIDAIEIFGGVYAVSTTETDDTGDTGRSAVWYGKVGKKPKPLLLAVDSVNQAGRFTKPTITPTAVYVGEAHVGDEPDSSILRVSPSKHTLESMTLDPSRYGFDEESGEADHQIDSLAILGASADVGTESDTERVTLKFRSGADFATMPK